MLAIGYRFFHRYFENDAYQQVKYYLLLLIQLCTPLIISSLSASLMIFFDRIILAQHDSLAMIGAASASNLFFIFQLGLVSLCSIAQIFVSQAKGAKSYQKSARAVWQMIWLALFFGLITTPIAILGKTWFFPPHLIEQGGNYFMWMMLFCPIFGIAAALSAFFIGQQQMKIVTYSIILSNLLNAALVMLFVFGKEPWLSPMGGKGAAIATGIAESMGVLLLFITFLKASYREKFHTHHLRLRKQLLLRCLKIGLPNSIGHMVSAGAWAFMMYLLSFKSLAHITVMSLMMSVWLFFSFITEALQRGVSTLTAHCVGAGQRPKIKSVLHAGLILQLLLSLILAFPLLIAPEYLINCLLPFNHNDLVIYDLAQKTCYWLWWAYLFDGMVWIIDGLLVALEDTQFIMWMNTLGTWIFCVVPVYWWVIKPESHPLLTSQLVTIFCIILFSSYYLRYQKVIKQKNDPLYST